MAGTVLNLSEESLQNEFFRKVLVTSPNCQLVLMSLEKGEDIGMETHQLDQFIYIVSGSGKSVLDGQEHSLLVGSGVVIPAGTEHNIVNDGETVMKLFTVYSPAEHADGTVHKTKAEAMSAEAEEH